MEDITNNPKCFENDVLNNSCLLQKAGNQDLERFRLTTLAPTAVSNQCTLYVTGTTPANVPILSSIDF